MNARNTFFVLTAFSCLLQFSCATEWSFNFPYYLLLGGIEYSVDQPFRNYMADYGYPVEVHSDVETEDGYLLTLFRIPYGVQSNNSDVEGKPVAFIMHGLFLSADDWVVLGPNKSLPLLLADAGYDVWLGNARGNIHSRKHVKYDPTWNGKFWDFSFHEIGYYDLPANIDYILSQTKQEQLYYFGHSQGGTTFVVLNSLRPEYNERFKLATLLAPAIYAPSCENPGFRALSISNELDNFIFDLGFKELNPHLKLYSFLGDTICKIEGFPQTICKEVHFWISSGISPHFDQRLLPKMLQHQYAGTSFKQSIHYAQWVKSGRVAQYDHGKDKNLKVYGSEAPPEYNLTNVVAPIAFYYGQNDKLIPPEDQRVAIQLLPNVVDPYLLPYSEFTHLDVYFGEDAPSQAYDRALKLMQQY